MMIEYCIKTLSFIAHCGGPLPFPLFFNWTKHVAVADPHPVLTFPESFILVAPDISCDIEVRYQFCIYFFPFLKMI